MAADASSTVTTQERWWSVTGERRAEVLKTVCNNLERVHGPRRRRALRNVQLYEGRKLAGLHPYAYFSDGDLSTANSDLERINLTRALVNTALAKVAGKQRPKAQFVCTEADWTTKRRAKKLERFVEGQMLARQDGHHDAYSLGVAAFRDCCVTDWGALKFWGDTVEKRIVVERILPWELLFDPYEARAGSPRNLFHVYGYDRDQLAVRFPEHKQAIMEALSLEEELAGSDSGYETYGFGTQIARMVKVREAWRLPFSPEKPGMHSIVVGDKDMLDGEAGEWTRPFFPVEIFVWEPWMSGICGTSIVDNVVHIANEVNAAVDRWAKAEKLGSNFVILCEDESVAEEDLASNEQAVIVKYRKGSQKPDFIAPNVISETSYNYITFMKGMAFEVPGISQQSATAQKEPGVDAAVAMRTIENIGSERLAIPWQHYERVMAIGAARQIVACCRELEEAGEDIEAKWPGAGFMLPLKWKDCSLEDAQYQAQVYAVSGLINTPADRLELAQELADRQFISPDAYLRIIQFKDVESEIGGTTRQSVLIEKYIEQWLDADPEKQESGEFRYRPPIPFMALEDAILQVGRAYLDAEMDDAPDFNLGFFVRYMNECDVQIAKRQARQAQLQAAAQGKGQAPGPQGMGAPPMGPPPGGAPMPAPNGMAAA